MRRPVLAAIFQLISQMMRNPDHVLTRIRFNQIRIAQRIFHLLPVVLAENIVIAVLAGALPLVAHKHRESGGVDFLRKLAQRFPVFFNHVQRITVFHAQPCFILTHCIRIIGNRPEIHHLLYLVKPLRQFVHLFMVNVAVHIRPKNFIIHASSSSLYRYRLRSFLFHQRMKAHFLMKQTGAVHA